MSFSNGDSGQRTRQQICREAARLMAEEGVIDHQSAKTKAVERLGLPAKSKLPDNREIEHALIEHLELFDRKALVERRRQWRASALEAMQLLADFNPKLIGPVLSGTITRYSAVQLLVSTSPETISIFLDDREIPYEQDQRRARLSTQDYIYLPTFHFLVDDVRFELICCESDSLSRTLLCPITGKPYRRAGINELTQLVADAGQPA